jgi:hypothetical protein
LPKNEDGEFELVLGNKQLLSMFFVVVVLLGVFFVMGYIVGRNSAPLIATDIPHKPEVKPPVVDSPAPKETPPPQAEVAPPPAKTVPPPEKAAEKAPEPAPSTPAKATPPPAAKPAPVQVTKAEPPKPEPPAKREPKATEKTEAAKATKAAPVAAQQPGGQPLPGAIYLQLSATIKADADKVVESLRKNGFPALDKEVPEKLGTFRVLVGPIPSADVNKTRTALDGKGFPGTGAIPRRF